MFKGTLKKITAIEEPDEVKQQVKQVDKFAGTMHKEMKKLEKVAEHFIFDQEQAENKIDETKKGILWNSTAQGYTADYREILKLKQNRYDLEEDLIIYEQLSENVQQDGVKNLLPLITTVNTEKKNFNRRKNKLFNLLEEYENKRNTNEIQELKDKYNSITDELEAEITKIERKIK